MQKDEIPEAENYATPASSLEPSEPEKENKKRVELIFHVS
jgi:hypothetical protein